MLNYTVVASKKDAKVKISTVIQTPATVASLLARRARKRRIAAGLSREALAAKAGVSRDTVKRFEQTGQGTLESLLRIALALGTLGEWESLFAEPETGTLTLDALEKARALEVRARAPRQRARRAKAVTPRDRGR